MKNRYLADFIIMLIFSIVVFIVKLLLNLNLLQTITIGFLFCLIYCIGDTNGCIEGEEEGNKKR